MSFRLSLNSGLLSRATHTGKTLLQQQHTVGEKKGIGAAASQALPAS